MGCVRFQFEGGRILSVVYDACLGLCVELGDDKCDGEVYGFAPTRAFIKALEREIRFQIKNAGERGEHPLLERVYERFKNAQKRSS